MAYRQTDNTVRLMSEFKAKNSLAIRIMLEDIHKTAHKNTPKLHGLLRADVLKEVKGGRGKIKWKRNYAKYQERGYTSGPVKHYTTPGTGAHFAENAVRKVTKNTNKYLKMVGLSK